MSNAVAVIRRLHQHRAWVNDNLLAAAGALAGEPLRRQFPIGQGSIWMSLVHLYAAEFVWLEALLGNEDPVARGDLPGRIPGNQLGERPFTTLDELRHAWAQLAARWTSYLEGLTEQSLEEPVYKLVSSTQARAATRRVDVLLHVCTHAHYTAAQVVNMLRHAGIERMPDTMLISLARQEAGRTA
jgi:uncharacterized damage-inducible protein DinB